MNRDNVVALHLRNTECHTDVTPPAEYPAVNESTTDVRATESWPFGDNTRAIKGWLNSVNDAREANIVDFGGYQRAYPVLGGGVSLFDVERRTCSKKGHMQPGLGPCECAWEDDFRYGKYKGLNFVPPSARIIIGNGKNGKSVLKMSRYRRRPDVECHDRKLRSIKQSAYEKLPLRVPQLTLNLAQSLLGEPLRLRKPGGPRIPIEDIVMLLLLRVQFGTPYNQMDHVSSQALRDGLVQRGCDWRTLNEYATKHPEVLEFVRRMHDRARLIFRFVSPIAVIDSQTLSTASSDSPRLGRYAQSEDGGTSPVQVRSHIAYDLRWGYSRAHRLTWTVGLGSNDGPQLPYLNRCMVDLGMKPDYDVCDSAYSSEYNFYDCDKNGIMLVSPLKKDSWNPKTKNLVGLARAETILNDFHWSGMKNPAAQMLYPFRPVCESWHSAHNNAISSYIHAWPDRSLIPTILSKAGKYETEKAERELGKTYAEREAQILKYQNVGLSVEIEHEIRRLLMTLRATVQAEEWYQRKIVNYGSRFAFEPIPEDDAMMPWRDIQHRRDLAA